MNFLRLFSKETRDESTIISHTISHRPRPPSPSSSSSSDDEFEELQIARDQYFKNRQNLKKKKPTFVESKLRQGKLPESIRTENETIDYVLTCLYEWITMKTREFLNDSTVKTSNSNEIDQKRYENLVRRIEIDQINDSTGQRAERGLPTMEQLQQDQYAIKVKEFLCGKTREEVRKSTKRKTFSIRRVVFFFFFEKEPLPIVLPPIDSISQQSIRLSIVNEKVQTWFDENFRRKKQKISIVFGVFFFFSLVLKSFSPIESKRNRFETFDRHWQIFY